MPSNTTRDPRAAVEVADHKQPVLTASRAERRNASLAFSGSSTNGSTLSPTLGPWAAGCRSPFESVLQTVRLETLTDAPASGIPDRFTTSEERDPWFRRLL
jgi:hypothetical protein